MTGSAHFEEVVSGVRAIVVNECERRRFERWNAGCDVAGECKWLEVVVV